MATKDAKVHYSSDEDNCAKDEQKTQNATTGEPAKSEAGLGSYFRLFKYTDRLGWILNIIAFTASIAAGATLPLMSVIFGSGISNVNSFSPDSAADNSFREQILRNVRWFVYLFVARLVLIYVGTLCISISAVRTTRAIREAYLENMLRREIWHFDSQVTGSIAIQVTTNAARINKGLADQLGIAVQFLSTFFSAFIVALAVQWKLALITLSVIPAMFLITAVCLKLDTRIENHIVRLYSEAGRIAEEVFSSIRTVQAFWAQSKVVKDYDSHLNEAKRLGLKKTPIWAVFISNQYFCIYSGLALAFWQGFRMYQEGEIPDVGKVFTVILSVLIASSAISAILPQFENFSRAAASASEIFETLDQASKLDPFDERGERPVVCEGRIEVRNLEFAYPSRPQVRVLKGLNLSIPAGKTTALVGASGCGKSTLVGLLERWYERTSGKIELDGVDIDKINTKWLRSHMRLVQQEPVLFSGTVFKNVACGFLDSQRKLPVEEQMELVKRACEASFAHEFIEQLPKGYHTELGERGATLSGGQRQRIAIARSIVSDPQILLLDEATSALDPKAEKIVQKALDNISTSRTTLVIAHKLATIRNADNIAIIADGCVAEQGSHDELLQSDGLYAKLVAAQDLGDEDESEQQNSQSKIDLFTDDMNELIQQKSQAQSQQNVGNDIISKKAEKSLGYSLLKVIWVVFKEQKELRLNVFITVLACLTAGATFPGQAILYSKIIPIFNLTGSEAKSRADFYALMFFVVALGNTVAYIFLGANVNIISQKATYYYRHELYTNLMKQDTKFYDDSEHTTGAITSMLTTLPNQLQQLIAANVFLMIIIVVTVVASSILAIAYGYRLGLLLVFAGLPPLLIAGWGRIRLEMHLENKNSDRFSASAGLANEAITSIKTVSSLALEHQIISEFSSIMQDVVQNSIKSYVWTLFWYALSQALDLLVMALGLWYGSRLLLEGTYDITQFYVIFIGVLFAGQNAAQFFGYTTTITAAQSAANYMFWLRVQAPVVQEDDSNKDSGPPSDDGSVELSSLTFCYPTRKRPALDNISLKVGSGQFAAFVGPSGCGKSTLINLLERFYEPSSGEVKFGGTSISAYSPRLYRKNVSLVQQEPMLFSGTIRENIMLGLEASEENLEGEKLEARIIEACKQANAYEFIESLPAGLSTPCGNRGLQFSGGQKQRIAIARALVRQPRLLLLDEATSALDTESERVVQAALDQVMEGRTTIAVAHRLSTIKHADIIFVFGNGHIVEQGTHTELLAKRGRYYEMCLSQSMDRTA